MLGPVGLALAVAVSFTHPFTLAADVVMAGVLVLAAAQTIRVLTGHRLMPGHDRRAPLARWWPLWLIPVGATVAWELYCLFHLPRNEHPTFSALIDMLDSTPVGKAVAVVLWLLIGWALVSR
jgi:hypothetical protein